MPYANKTKQKQYMAKQYRTRYREDDKFREAENDRKRDWYQRNREKVISKTLENRAKRVKK
jgi:hypothetical protein